MYREFKLIVQTVNAENNAHTIIDTNLLQEGHMGSRLPRVVYGCTCKECATSRMLNCMGMLLMQRETHNSERYNEMVEWVECTQPQERQSFIHQ